LCRLYHERNRLVVSMESLTMLENSPDKKAILVVDDDVSMRSLIVDALDHNGGFVTNEASDGQEALHALQTGPYDMVISDFHMPGMNGIELISRIREINPAIYVIMITAFPSIGLSVTAMKRGAVDFLEKPLRIDDLLHKVNIYLREKAMLSEKEIICRTEVTQLEDKVNELTTRSFIYDAVENARGNNDKIFQEIVELSLKIVEGESCDLFLYNEETEEFHPKFSKHLAPKDYDPTMTHQLNRLFGEIAHTGQARLFNTRNEKGPSSYICVPLKIRNSIFGVLSLTRKKSGGIFTERDLNFILSLANRASLNFENKILYESVYTNLLETFKSLISSIQFRDNYTEVHSVNVTNLAIGTAEVMGCSSRETESLQLSAMLHDIGKIAIPDNILLKPGRLTAEEYAVIKNHPGVGDNILAPVLLLETERKIIRHHHERWDGKGYPDGLAGEEIPVLSRILSVADAFDAMVTDRPYRKGMSREEAVAELKENSGRQFDSQVVDAFLRKLPLRY
jgi:response regulator RpfG family c-di-GMP phosphodiesterase